MKSHVSFAAAAALAFIAAPASAEFKLDRSQIENFDGPAIGQVLDQREATWKKVTDDGPAYYEFTLSNGYQGSATPVACTDEDARTGCSGLIIVAYFDRPQGATDEGLAKLINSFNFNHSASNAFIDDDGTPAVSMYVIADYGITPSNLYVHFQTFESLCSLFDDAIYPDDKETSPDQPASE